MLARTILGHASGVVIAIIAVCFGARCLGPFSALGRGLEEGDQAVRLQTCSPEHTSYMGGFVCSYIDLAEASMSMVSVQGINVPERKTMETRD